MQPMGWRGLVVGLGLVLAAIAVSCTDMGDLELTDVTDASKDSGAADAPSDAREAGPDADADGATDARPEVGETGGKTWEVRVGNAAVTDGGAASKVFLPDSLNIAVGDTVKWIWDEDGHNVMSGDPSTCTPDLKFCSPSDTNCNKPPVSPKGTVYQRQFLEAGMFMYYCRPHCGDGMSGMIMVK